MRKRIVVISIISVLGLLCAACADDAADACEHLNEICNGKKSKADCAKANDDYEKLNKNEKEAVDKVIDCVMDTDDCSAALRCGAAAFTKD